jgi:hypothetical protein
VVVALVCLTVLSPSIEVILHVHTAANALRRANRPVLLESPRAIDGGLVGAGGHHNIVGAAVSCHASLALRAAGWIVRAIRFNNVVLHEGIASPAVNGEVAVALGRKGTAVVNSTGCSRQ